MIEILLKMEKDLFVLEGVIDGVIIVKNKERIPDMAKRLDKVYIETKLEGTKTNPLEKHFNGIKDLYEKVGKDHRDYYVVLDGIPVAKGDKIISTATVYELKKTRVLLLPPMQTDKTQENPREVYCKVIDYFSNEYIYFTGEKIPLSDLQFKGGAKNWVTKVEDFYNRAIECHFKGLLKKTYGQYDFVCLLNEKPEIHLHPKRKDFLHRKIQPATLTSCYMLADYKT